jgi:hypothetical protein
MSTMLLGRHAEIAVPGDTRLTALAPRFLHRMRMRLRQRQQAAVLRHVEPRLRDDAGLPAAYPLIATDPAPGWAFDMAIAAAGVPVARQF